MIRTIAEPGYKILIVEGDQPLDDSHGNVDVIVELDSGVAHAAVFSTIDGIKERMNHFRRTGECAHGLYFWTSDLIIVEHLTEETIRRTVQSLLETEDFEMAFSEPSFDIVPNDGDNE